MTEPVKYFPTQIKVYDSELEAQKRIKFLKEKGFDQFDYWTRNVDERFYVIGALKTNRKKKYYL